MNKNETEKRAIILGNFISSKGATVRQTAKAFGVSKSTVHTDVSKKLYYIDRELWEKVQKVLLENKSQRHIRGGEATRKKYSR